ncbi:NADH-quinone oxidoreductase subunit NuoH [Calditerricola satsumensis]|uniref:NADH-quinone oxidoreductase subunit H n=1 Tax=Calditerricola satsumensis TaxID=373054 RepID=A0A8J3B8N6_9BACI|nr:NADH-quinone oxidoreductase subunit NuoH [Calditerricola satsumensis]GGJ96061.1 NADH-quinone oxidoreductase subunit H [Calditerricola satsumensis]
MAHWLSQPLSWTTAAVFLASAVAMLLTVLLFVTLAIYFERKVIGWIQLRRGPNRVGPYGILQSVADVLKLLTKEDVIPDKADRTLFVMAPVIAFVPAFAVLAVLPFTETLHFADLGVGLLYYVAVSGITTLGILLGGWASNNKYALLGGMRSVAQMISYEIPLVISVIGVVLLAGSLNLKEIVAAQSGGIWNWFFLKQILGFAVFVVAAIAELNRTPFDLPEAESELVAGYHVEYSGFRFAFFMLAEYVYVFAMSALATILFLGGWHPPVEALDFVPGLVWFALKFAFCVFFLFWLRATMPRVRVDQLMTFAWKALLPLALANLLVTALVKELVA